ncbi:hypothetical protein BC828DRAFT_139978 [Blastocladiella britannica]|nr:hypothetical protein BC828DRAFT_139978 [Blastocladiella britannica]
MDSVRLCGRKNLDSVSEMGHVNVLWFWFMCRDSNWVTNSYSDKAVTNASANGHVSVLEFWWQKHQAMGLPFLYNAGALDSASSNCHFAVLEWFWQRHIIDGIALYCTQKIVESAARTGCCEIVEWWHNKCQVLNKPKFFNCIFQNAVRGGRADIMDILWDHSPSEEHRPQLKLSDLCCMPASAQLAMFDWWAERMLSQIQCQRSADKIFDGYRGFLLQILKNATWRNDIALLDAWMTVAHSEPRLQHPDLFRDGITIASNNGMYHVLWLWLRASMDFGYTIPQLHVSTGAGTALNAEDPRALQLWWYMYELHGTPFRVDENEIRAAIRDHRVDSLTWLWSRISQAPTSVQDAFFAANPFLSELERSQAVMAFWFKVQLGQGIETFEDARVADRQCLWSISRRSNTTRSIPRGSLLHIPAELAEPN